MDMMSFYSVYYILVSLYIGIFRVDSLLAHFDYTTQPFGFPAQTVIYMELTYLSRGLIFAWIVEERVWDYAITVTLIHIDLTVAGKQDSILNTLSLILSILCFTGSGLVMMMELFRNNFVYLKELQNFWQKHLH
uniref:Uncharacterized protein n=1 Tax=Hucho hucho TaxID=62062 RepID=A0A4W5JWV8_9TELE